jgi:hypothetical protein
VHLLDVVLEVVGVLEQLLTSQIKTLEDARRGGVVSSHVPLEAHVAFEVFPTQQTRVQNGGVLEGGVAHRPSNVQPHMQTQSALAIETPAAKVARNAQSSKVPLAVSLQLQRGIEYARAIIVGALDFARNWRRVQF